MENFSHLLKEGFAVELGRANKSILSEQNVFTLESGVEVFIKKVKGLIVSSVEDDFYGVLQVDRHLLIVKIVPCFLSEAFFCAGCFALYREN